MSIKPQHTFLMLIGVGALALIMMLIFPSNGIKLTDTIEISFPNTKDYFTLDSDTTFTKPIENVEEFLDLYTVQIDSTAIKDSISKAQILEIKRKQDLMKIQYLDSNIFALNHFFKSLDNIDESPVRIMHFGDSQIEGDRMTGYLRNEFQKKFGGIGCGLLPIFERFPTFAMKQSDSGNWKRHAAFFSNKKKSKNNKYGVLANYSRFTEPLEDSLIIDSIVNSAWARFVPNKKTYRRAGKYEQIRFLYGHNKRTVLAQLYFNDKILLTDTLYPTTGADSKIWSIPNETIEDLKIVFFGADSPDIYGLSFENESGIHIDNIPMRGSSGTVFTKIDKEQLQLQFDELSPSLIILQYGGNAVPSIKSKKKAKEYGQWFEAQIKFLKRINPNASFILIGPSDMTEIVDNKYQTRKYLTDVRDALKLAAFNTNCGFWDLFEVMGGENSMISWVEAEPPLAAKDYTHFAPGGARKISKLFYTALMNDYKLWQKNVPKNDE